MVEFKEEYRKYRLDDVLDLFYYSVVKSLLEVFLLVFGKSFILK